MFLVSVILARQLPSDEYGIFALLIGGIFTLQQFNATLLFYPLQIQLAVTNLDDQGRLLGASLILIGLMSMLLGGVLALVLIVSGRADLAPAALACFLSWQLQEATRRGLQTNFRYRAATLGDAASYIGKVIIVLGLVITHSLTVSNIVYGLAVTSGLAAIAQAFQLNLRLQGPYALRETITKYWSVGGLWSLGNGLLSNFRMQSLPWLLTVSSGPAAAASFQAALNIVNLSNPILQGISSIIPQTAAQAKVDGDAHAWRAVRFYAVVTMAPIILFSTCILIVPTLVLELLYGAGSQYLDLSLPLQLLIIAGLAGCATEIFLTFLHGISAVRFAFIINAVGAFTTALLAIPFISSLGLTGGCLALVGGNLSRLIAAHLMLMRVTAEPSRHFI